MSGPVHRLPLVKDVRAGLSWLAQHVSCRSVLCRAELVSVVAVCVCVCTLSAVSAAVADVLC